MVLYLLKAMIELRACKAIEDTIERSPHSEVVSATYRNDKEQFLVGCAQVYSDKSKTSHFLSKVFFNSLHLTKLTLLKKQLQNLTYQGLTVLANLPILWRETYKASACLSDKVSPLMVSK